jgi:hypothetical protein
VKTKLPHRVGEMGHPRRRFWRNRNIWPTRNTQREANYAQLASRSFGLILRMRVFFFRQCSLAVLPRVSPNRIGYLVAML